MRPPLRIRAVTLTDGPAFFALRREAILSGCRLYYPKETLERWTATGPQETLREPLAEHFYAGFEETMVVSGLLEAGSGRIDALFVHAHRQGRGLGKLMMAHLESIARRVGLEALSLHATLNAAPFYRALGFLGDEIVAVKSPRGIVIASVPMTKTLT